VILKKSEILYMTAESLTLKSKINNLEVLLYPTLIEVNSKFFLVDCGYEETYEDLIQLLRTKKIEASDLHGILISHDDIDHIGALHKFKEANPGVVVMASQIEEPSLSGKIKSERLNQAENLLNDLPDDQKEWALAFQQSLTSIKRIPVNILLNDNEFIENEIKVIHTPGHTKGHLSFYLPSSKLLIANDAFIVENNEFDIANPQFTLDIQAALNSIRKLQTLDIHHVYCYHGGEYKGDVMNALKKLLDKY